MMPFRDLPNGRRLACPCCGCFTLTEAPPGTYDICAVCSWEDDDVPPDFGGGANDVSLDDDVSLDEARGNHRAFGASDERFKSRVRAPEPRELP